MVERESKVLLFLLFMRYFDIVVKISDECRSLLFLTVSLSRLKDVYIPSNVHSYYVHKKRIKMIMIDGNRLLNFS